MTIQTFTVSGMTCQHCVTQVQILLSSVTGVRNVTVSLMPPRANVDGNADLTALTNVLANTQFSISSTTIKQATQS